MKRKLDSSHMDASQDFLFILCIYQVSFICIYFLNFDVLLERCMSAASFFRQPFRSLNQLQQKLHFQVGMAVFLL